ENPPSLSKSLSGGVPATRREESFARHERRGTPFAFERPPEEALKDFPKGILGVLVKHVYPERPHHVHVHALSGLSTSCGVTPCFGESTCRCVPVVAVLITFRAYSV
ncbi:unnamed protein product, partial [Ectocarpus sp. 4 AP-2014]